MTLSSTANTWFYEWAVDESFNGNGYATISGSDKYGNASLRSNTAPET